MGTSNIGRVYTTPGGVARNVAEGLARLGVRVQLIAAVGRDADGDALIRQTAQAGVDVTHVLRSQVRTGSYTAVLDANGELVVAISEMDATEELTGAAIHEARALIGSASLLVLDCNVPCAGLRVALEAASSSRVPVMIDPVSVTKATRLRALLAAGIGRIHTVTPNLAELNALTDDAVECADLAAQSAVLHDMGVQNVWTRLGDAGSAMSSVAASAASQGATGGHSGRRNGIPDPIERFEFPVTDHIVDVTGAGDAMLAGYAFAVLRGMSPLAAVRYGHAAAALTIASDQTVHPALSAALLERSVTGDSTPDRTRHT